MGICALALAACDLQPKIVALPDTVGEFISSRYPALLADPETQPEIYNAASTDYGVYAAPNLYGAVDDANYVEYASVNDYIVPPSVTTLYGELPTQSTSVSVDAGGAIIADAENEYLHVPMYGGTEMVSSSSEITVAAGDTLYSLSRKYSVPVNDLAVMNDLSAPFTLSVGQRIKVPNLDSAPVVSRSTASTGATQSTVASAPAKEKISSDPKQKLPTISARSSSKFSWPVRGKILSHYGAKSGGLFNDGINIGAARGTPVVAAENGVVAYAGNEVKGMGNLIIIQHSGGWMTVYAHLDSMNVRRGTKVSVGQKIGSIGETGKVDQPQLHFEIRKGTKAYNPSSYLK